MSELPYEWDFDALESCALEQMHVHQCRTCGLEPSFTGLDDCAKCFCAYALSEDPEQLHDLSGWSKEDQATLTKELDRQSQAMLSECYITTKPAVLEDL